MNYFLNLNLALKKIPKSCKSVVRYAKIGNLRTPPKNQNKSGKIALKGAPQRVLWNFGIGGSGGKFFVLFFSFKILMLQTLVGEICNTSRVKITLFCDLAYFLKFYF